jgi:uracil DNA glycosylase
LIWWSPPSRDRPLLFDDAIEDAIIVLTGHDAANLAGYLARRQRMAALEAPAPSPGPLARGNTSHW